MSDTLVTVGTPPSVGPALGGSYVATGSGMSGPSEGQIFLQVTLPYYASPKMCLDSAKWIDNYIKTHSLSDSKTLQVVRDNISDHCIGDMWMVNYPKLSPYQAIHNGKDFPTKYDYVTRQMTQLSGDVTTPITAWAHYLWGNGAARTVNLSDVGLRIQPNQITPVMNIVNSGAVGTFNISGDAGNFNRNTMLDGIIPAAYLGNISMRTEGVLTIVSSGAWNYNGVVRAFDDKYDANPSTYRGPIGEYSTSVLAHFSGQEFPIHIPGQLDIKGTGFR